LLQEVEVFERELAALLNAKYPTPILEVHHAVIAKSPQS